MAFTSKSAQIASRKSATVRGQFRVWDSMRQASAELGIAFEDLREIKRKGARAFRWSKCYEKDLLAWIGANLTKNEDEDYVPTETESLADRVSVAIWRKRIKESRAAKGLESHPSPTEAA